MLLQTDSQNPNGGLDRTAVDQLFRAARTHSAWLDRPVSDAQLRSLYALTKLGPTSANSSPGRFVFLRSRAAKERMLANKSLHAAKKKARRSVDPD